MVGKGVGFERFRNSPSASQKVRRGTSRIFSELAATRRSTAHFPNVQATF